MSVHIHRGVAWTIETHIVGVVGEGCWKSRVLHARRQERRTAIQVPLWLAEGKASLWASLQIDAWLKRGLL